MHSYKSLAVLALAVSTASTAYSAPVQESQQQARSVIDVFNAGKDDLTGPSNISAIVNSLHPLETFKSVGARDTVDLDERGSFGGLGRLLNGFGSNGFLKALGGGASGIATTVAGDLANKALNSTRRAFPNQSLNNPCNTLGSLQQAKKCLAFLNTPVAQDDVSARDVIDALQFLKRQLIELD
ncbi:hypothetical protein V8E53_001082 [Lactarius tabidus]